MASLLLITSGMAVDQIQKQEIAKKLANPLAAIVSIPIQVHYKPNMGLNDEGSEWLTNIQPIVPFTINDEWTLLTRTIIPIISQDTGIPSVGTVDGVGDILFTAWLAPQEKTESGWLWGMGGAFLLPSGSEMSSEKWGAGPSAIALHQGKHINYGILANHVWSYAGSNRVTNDVSITHLQPFASYVTDGAITFSCNTESNYDWKTKEWTVPVTVLVSKIVHIGKLPFSVGVGTTYWAEAPENGPEGWGAKFAVTFILPKKIFGL